MTTHRPLLLVAAILSLSLTGMAPNAVRAVRRRPCPTSSPIRDYWNLVTDLSEPDGVFRSDNLLSNELFFQSVIPELAAQRESRARLPRRRSRAELHLHRRAQTEDGLHRRHPSRQPAAALDVQGALRARLGIAPTSSSCCSRGSVPRASAPSRRANEIFTALHKAAPEPADASELRFKQNLKVLQDHLTHTRELPLTADDFKGIEYVYGTFSLHGPGLDYWSTSGRGGGRNAPTYWDLMVADDGKGQHAELSRQRGELHGAEGAAQKNLVVPVVGNFAGPKALEPWRATSRSATRPCRRSTCRMSSSTCSAKAPGMPSAPTRRRCRSTNRAGSSDPSVTIPMGLVSASTRRTATCSRKSRPARRDSAQRFASCASTSPSRLISSP